MFEISALPYPISRIRFAKPPVFSVSSVVNKAEENIYHGEHGEHRESITILQYLSLDPFSRYFRRSAFVCVYFVIQLPHLLC